MRQVRKSLFETNSSSTHAICVSKENQFDEQYYDWYIYENDEFYFGRCESCLIESFIPKLAYIYFIVLEVGNKDEQKQFVTNLHEIAKEFYSKDMWHKFNKTILDNILVRLRKKFKNGGVDHTESFRPMGFFDKLINDKEFVKRLLWNDDSYITIGSDEHRGYNIKTIGFEYDYNGDEFENKLNEYKKDFDVFLKGN